MKCSTERTPKGDQIFICEIEADEDQSPAEADQRGNDHRDDYDNNEFRLRQA